MALPEMETLDHTLESVQAWQIQARALLAGSPPLEALQVAEVEAANLPVTVPELAAVRVGLISHLASILGFFKPMQSFIIGVEIV